MRRGEVWWVELDERRPVVLLSDDSPYQAIQVVPAVGGDLGDLGVEVPVGATAGLPFPGVLRVGFLPPGFTSCTWLTTLTHDALLTRAGALTEATLATLDAALDTAAHPPPWTPATAARYRAIADALRAGPR
jgi:mRNA interferase MazF